MRQIEVPAHRVGQQIIPAAFAPDDGFFEEVIVWWRLGHRAARDGEHQGKKQVFLHGFSWVRSHRAAGPEKEPA